ncbi:MAG: hypothetical protein KF841_14855 [Phycisphaerae bacterium]|nr:hypothetical protein [Phycisphaerae bacterium]
MRGRLILGVLMAVGMAANTVRADVVTDWNEILLDAIRESEMPSPKAARAIAMMNLAMYDTINSFSPTHDTYLTAGTPGIGATRDASGVAAARRILVALFPGQQATFDAAVTAYIGGLPEFIFAPSDAYGVSIANALLGARDADGSSVNLNYDPGAGPGEWQPTPPSNAPAQLLNFASVLPFGMQSGSQFRRSGPPDLTSARYTADFDEVSRYGTVASVHRTADQTQFARFWEDGPGTATTPGHWIEIAITIAKDNGNTVEQNARVFALIGMAMADAGICTWDNKYAFDDWRPITAIRNAGADGNDATDEDAGWTPLIETPPTPGYISARSAYAAAAARMIEIIYGSNDIGFAATSDSLEGVTRNFTSLSGAAREAGFSGVVGGTCFRYAYEDGYDAGRDVAGYIHANYLRRLPATSSTGTSSACGSGACGLGGLFTVVGSLVGLPIIRRGNRKCRRR